MDKKHEITARIARHTRTIAELYIEMSKGTMNHAEQSDAILTLAQLAIQLAEATASMFNEISKDIDEDKEVDPSVARFAAMEMN